MNKNINAFDRVVHKEGNFKIWILRENLFEFVHNDQRRDKRKKFVINGEETLQIDEF